MAHERATLLKPQAVQRRPPPAALYLSSAGPAPNSSRSSAASVSSLAAVSTSSPVTVQCARISHPANRAAAGATQAVNKAAEAIAPAIKAKAEVKKNTIVQRAEASPGRASPAKSIAPIARSPPSVSIPAVVSVARPTRAAAPIVAATRSTISPGIVSVSSPVSVQCARISTPNDPAEQEARLTARKVMEMASPSKPSPSVNADANAKKRKDIVRRADAGAAKAATVPTSISLSGGHPLPRPVRTFMEPRFGASFGNVRIHTGESAAQQSAQLNAHAFTIGEHVFFGRNQFQPDSASGRELIAHELTHTIQQGAAIQRSAKPVVSQRTGPEIQRGVIGDAWDWVGQKAGEAIDFGESAGWALLQRFAPDLVPIVRRGPSGIFDWLKSKAEAAAETALNVIAAPVRAVGGVGDRLAARFAHMAAVVQQAAAQIAQNDCTPLKLAAQKIEATATAIVKPIVEFLQPIVTKVKKFLEDALQLVGAPIWDWIKQRAAEHWEAIQWLWDKIKKVAGWIWDNTASFRAMANKAWTWLKNKLGIGEGPEGEHGLLQWVQGKVETAWNAIKVKLEPYRQQIMTVGLAVGGVLLMLSPAGPIVAVGAAVTGAIQGLRWIQANWGKGDAIVRARLYLEQNLIPGLTSALERIMAVVSRAAGALASALNTIAGGLAQAAAAIQSSVLKLAAGVVQWLAAQAQALANWAAGGLASLNASIKTALSSLKTFLNKMLNFLSAVGRAVLDIWKLPALIIGGIWNAIPACIRDPVADFLGRLILGQIELFQELVSSDEAWAKTKKDVLNIIKLVFKDGNLMGALHATFDLILRVFNIGKDLLVQIKAKAIAAWDIVRKKPLAFIKNVVRSIGAGFRLLKDNFREHLEYGLKEWLLGPLAEKGITPPEKWTDVRQVFNFVLDVMGISVDHVFELIGKRIGEDRALKLKERFKQIVGVVALVTELINVDKSPDENTKGIIDKAKGFAGTIFTGIAEWVAGRVAAELAQMAVAAAASAGLSEVLDVARRIYRALITAKRYARRVLDMVNQSLDNVLLIANGKVEEVGKKIEDILHRGMPVVIGFLADQVGLGGITQAIRDTIDGLRATVDDALMWVINKVANALEALAGAVKAGVAALLDWWNKKIRIGDKDEPHTLQFDGSAENSKLMVHSNTETVSAFLTRFQGIEGAGSDVAAAAALSKKIDDLTAQYREAKKKKTGKTDGLAKEISDSMDALGKVLISLLARDKPVELPPAQPQYKTGTLPGCDDIVGMRTTVDRLGADPTGGSEPQGSAQANLMNLLVKDPSQSSSDKFVRGHLLNHNLGGPGTAQNMFPITGRANIEHRTSTENRVKEWLKRMKAWKADPKRKKKDQRWIYYDVNVHGISSSLTGKKISENYVTASFACNAILKDAAGKVEEQFSTSVSSTYNVHSKAVKKDDVMDGKPVK